MSPCVRPFESPFGFAPYWREDITPRARVGVNIFAVGWRSHDREAALDRCAPSRIGDCIYITSRNNSYVAPISRAYHSTHVATKACVYRMAAPRPNPLDGSVG